MPRYFFVVEMPDHIFDDPDGERLPNDAAAKDYGERVVRELKESNFACDRATLHVKDERGRTVRSIPF